MKKKERLLFKQLCAFKADSFNEDLIEYATPHVLGYLFFNRMQGVAYGVLKKHGLIGKVNREFRNSLKSAYEKNIEKNNSFLSCVKEISELLSECDFKVAMLKGAYLCNVYPQGYRTSNDIDLLVMPKDVTAVGNVLSKAGFKQGNVKNGEFIPATRKEIIESKMMRGETVPYIKKVDLPSMKYLEIDINFSLDYKNSDIGVLSDFLKRAQVITHTGIRIPTLCKEDFLIHLCAHLYKEATTLPWVEMHRDMTLYKYCDIYMLLCEMSDTEITTVFERAKELGMEKVCAYAFSETAQLFNGFNKKAKKEAEKVLEDCPQFVLQVVSPKDKKTLIYQTSDTEKRFFIKERINDLKAVNEYEKT